MHSEKKLERVQTDSPEVQSLLRDIEKTVNSDQDINAVRKDIHLIHAALAADRSIVSCDETARQLFGNASAAVPDLSSIVWVNPDREAETPIRWLENGAEAESHRILADSGNSAMRHCRAVEKCEGKRPSRCGRQAMVLSGRGRIHLPARAGYNTAKEGASMGLTVLEMEVGNPASPEVTRRIEFLIDSGAVYSGGSHAGTGKSRHQAHRRAIVSVGRRLKNQPQERRGGLQLRRTHRRGRRDIRRRGRQHDSRRFHAGSPGPGARSVQTRVETAAHDSGRLLPARRLMPQRSERVADRQARGA